MVALLWAVGAEVEHREGDEGLRGAEPERDAGDESDLGVHGLDAPVGEVVLDGGEDRGAVFHDRALQADERGDAAAAGPADPVLERAGASVLGLLFMGAPRISSPAWMIRRTKLLCHIVVCCYRGTGIGSGARHDGLLG